VSRRTVVLAASCAALLLAGCGDDEGGTSTGASPATTATSATGGSATTGGSTGGTTTGGSTAGASGGAPAATAEQTAAIPSGLVPAASGSEADDPAVLSELRARMAKAPAALQRVGSARFRIELRLDTGPISGPGTADFRSGASETTLSLGSSGGGSIEQYNDGTDSFTRSGGSPWTKETPIIPNAPGNSTGIFAEQLRIGRAGAEATVDGVRCRWAAGVVPLRELLESGGASDAPQVQALLRVAKRDATYPIGACVSEDGLIAQLRYDIRFDRDLGLTGADGRTSFGGGITFSDFGKAPAVERPSGLPTG
jgi:hypothetical protein